MRIARRRGGEVTDAGSSARCADAPCHRAHDASQTPTCSTTTPGCNGSSIRKVSAMPAPVGTAVPVSLPCSHTQRCAGTSSRRRTSSAASTIPMSVAGNTHITISTVPAHTLSSAASISGSRPNTNQRAGSAAVPCRACTKSSTAGNGTPKATIAAMPLSGVDAARSDVPFMFLMLSASSSGNVLRTGYRLMPNRRHQCQPQSSGGREITSFQQPRNRDAGHQPPERRADVEQRQVRHRYQRS